MLVINEIYVSEMNWTHYNLYYYVYLQKNNKEVSKHHRILQAQFYTSESNKSSIEHRD